MATPPRSAELTVVRARRGVLATPLRVLGRRTVATLEGRLARTWLARSLPVAVLLFGLVSAGEIATVIVSGRAGLLIHAATFLLMGVHAALVRGLNPHLARLLVAAAPVTLIRIVSLTSPLQQFSYVQWFMVLAVILYAAIVLSIKTLKPRLADIGLKLPAAKHLPLEAGVILAGFAFGYIEYQILKPTPLVPELTASALLAPVLVIYVSTGLLEELLFRGVLQRYAGIALGTWAGIAFATAVFGILHAGWNSWLDIFFVAAVGGIFALVVKRTGSIWGVSVSHGITNVMLFLVMPLL